MLNCLLLFSAFFSPKVTGGLFAASVWEAVFSLALLLLLLLSNPRHSLPGKILSFLLLCYYFGKLLAFSGHLFALSLPISDAWLIGILFTLLFSIVLGKCFYSFVPFLLLPIITAYLLLFLRQQPQPFALPSVDFWPFLLLSGMKKKLPTGKHPFLSAAFAFLLFLLFQGVVLSSSASGKPCPLVHLLQSSGKQGYFIGVLCLYCAALTQCAHIVHIQTAHKNAFFPGEGHAGLPRRRKDGPKSEPYTGFPFHSL